MQIIASKYEVLRELGQGGYGMVYLVQHADIGARYALKLLSRSFSEDLGFIERFKHEAAVLVSFSHPRVAQLRDFGRTDAGLYYMTLDFCEGTLLQTVLAQEQWMPVIKVLSIVIQILETLEAAHTARVIHRDIKPGNVMLRRDEAGEFQITILDFGIAKMCESAATNSSVTREGTTIGTPQYMSPEQASAIPDLDHRVDLYATGVLMYELITGQVPFNGETVLQTLIKHLTQPPPPFAARLGIPAFIEDIVMRALEKDRDLRFQSASEYRTACQDALERLRGEPEIERQSDAIVALASANTPQLDSVTETKNQTKILCLDDNEMILNISRHIFEREGFTVFTASDFSAIHDYIFREGVKLMLCDVEMPGMPGSTICKMLKQSVPDLQVVLFSNIPERDLEKLSIESKADSWLSKNTKPEAWIEKVREMQARVG